MHALTNATLLATKEMESATRFGFTPHAWRQSLTGNARITVALMCCARRPRDATGAFSIVWLGTLDPQTLDP